MKKMLRIVGVRSNQGWVWSLGFSTSLSSVCLWYWEGCQVLNYAEVLIHILISTYTFDLTGLLACLELITQVLPCVEECPDMCWGVSVQTREKKGLVNCVYFLIGRHLAEEQSLNFKMRGFGAGFVAFGSTNPGREMCRPWSFVLIHTLRIQYWQSFLVLFHEVSQKNLYLPSGQCHTFFFLKMTTIGLGFYCYPF